MRSPIDRVFQNHFNRIVNVITHPLKTNKQMHLPNELILYTLSFLEDKILIEYDIQTFKTWIQVATITKSFAYFKLRRFLQRDQIKRMQFNWNHVWSVHQRLLTNPYHVYKDFLCTFCPFYGPDGQSVTKSLNGYINYLRQYLYLHNRFGPIHPKKKDYSFKDVTISFRSVQKGHRSRELFQDVVTKLEKMKPEMWDYAYVDKGDTFDPYFFIIAFDLDSSRGILAIQQTPSGTVHKVFR